MRKDPSLRSSLCILLRCAFLLRSQPLPALLARALGDFITSPLRGRLQRCDSAAATLRAIPAPFAALASPSLGWRSPLRGLPCRIGTMCYLHIVLREQVSASGFADAHLPGCAPYGRNGSGNVVLSIAIHYFVTLHQFTRR